MATFWAGPVPIQPMAPDYYLCVPEYGRSLSYIECLRAASTLQRGEELIIYNVDLNGPPSGHGPLTLPIYKTHGSCMISVELAGPTVPHAMNLIPNDIRGMAGWVIERCIIEGAGSGGFVTKDISNLIRHVVNPATSLNFPFPQASAFLTVTVSARSGDRKPEPGDNDPSVPLHIARYLSNLYRSAKGVLRTHYYNLALEFGRRADSMRRVGGKSWWSSHAADDMTYECDSKLGSPKVIDCTQVRSQLGATSDSVQIGAGEVKFLSSNTCHVAISAVRAIVLTWAQIQAALDTLTNRCISNPSDPAQGGRAFYGLQTTISGRRRKRGELFPEGKIKRQDAISGLNALPPGANLTIFEQLEPWQNDPANEVKSCTWKAVVGRQSVSACKAA